MNMKSFWGKFMAQPALPVSLAAEAVGGFEQKDTKDAIGDPAAMRKALGLVTVSEAATVKESLTPAGQPPRYANSRSGGRCQLPADQRPPAPPQAWRKDGAGAGVVVREAAGPELGQGDDLPVGLPPEELTGPAQWPTWVKGVNREAFLAPHNSIPKLPPHEVGVMESPAGPCVVDDHYERLLTMERLRVKEAEEERDALRKVVVRQQQDYDFCHEMSMDGLKREEELETKLGQALEMVKLKEAVIGMLRVRLEANAAAAGALKNSAGASSTALKSRAVKKAAPKKKGGAGK